MRSVLEVKCNINATLGNQHNINYLRNQFLGVVFKYEH